jgi:tetratricopeptide (TPR) repeat protein
MEPRRTSRNRIQAELWPIYPFDRDNRRGLSKRGSAMSVPRTCLRMVLLTAVVLGAGGRGRAVLGQNSPSIKSESADTAEAHMGRGYDAFTLDRYEVAASEFQSALQLNPGLAPKARLALAIARFRMQKFDEARREFETLRREEGDRADIVYYLGRLDLEDGDFNSAISHLNKAIAKPPARDTAYYLGSAYAKQGDLASAEKWLRVAVRLNPQDASMEYELGVVFRREGNEREARGALELSEKLQLKNAGQSQLWAECAQKLDQGSREEARAVCEQLYESDSVRNLTRLGTMYAQHGDLDSALKPFHRAAELAPQSPETQYSLALAYYQLKRFEEARTSLTSAVAQWPDIFRLNALYGAVLLKLGEERPAYETLWHAHQLNPGDPSAARLLYSASLVLAQKCRDARRYSDSLRYFQEAAKLRPDDPEPHRGMAGIYTLTNRLSQARAEHEAATRLSNFTDKR